MRGLAKTMPIIKSGYPKTSYLRSPRSTGNAFAQEQIIDELAYAAGMDPVAFRKQNVLQASADRLLAVLNAAAQAANWQPRVAASNLSDETGSWRDRTSFRTSELAPLRTLDLAPPPSDGDRPFGLFGARAGGRRGDGIEGGAVRADPAGS